MPLVRMNASKQRVRAVTASLCNGIETGTRASQARPRRYRIEYMLAGATQRSDSDPFDKTDPPIKIGPHWMILWPFDPKTSGLPTVHKATGAYIMYAGTPWAHVHVMGAP